MDLSACVPNALPKILGHKLGYCIKVAVVKTRRLVWGALYPSFLDDPHHLLFFVNELCHQSRCARVFIIGGRKTVSRRELPKKLISSAARANGPLIALNGSIILTGSSALSHVSSVISRVHTSSGRDFRFVKDMQ
jgi:hypothetical protein